MVDEKQIKTDRMRYIKNKLSSSLALVGILFNVIFFISIYRSNVGSYYYNAIIGISIIYNLLFLLIAFFCSEGVKTYSFGFAIALGIVGILQFARIFVIPAKAHSSFITIQKQQIIVMETAQFIRCIIYLSLSGISCIASSVIGIVKAKTLKEHLATLEEEKRRD